MLAAWRLGLKIRRATLERSEGSRARIEHDNPLKGINLEIDDSDRARLKAEKNIVVALAGPAAQRLYRPSSLRRHHGASDREIAMDLAFRLWGDLATAYLKWLNLRTVALLRTDWHFVQAFAAKLLKDGTLYSGDIDKLIFSMIEAHDLARRQRT
jgi:hypothetical protein